MNRSELQDNMIQQILDDMDIKTMMAILYDQMDENYDKYSDAELTEECKEYYPELLAWPSHWAHSWALWGVLRSHPAAALRSLHSTIITCFHYHEAATSRCPCLCSWWAWLWLRVPCEDYHGQPCWVQPDSEVEGSWLSIQVIHGSVSLFPSRLYSSCKVNLTMWSSNSITQRNS